ncbi:hypothetical protein Hanom_Chr15g01396261 [Helianthus anomalus]
MGTPCLMGFNKLVLSHKTIGYGVGSPVPTRCRRPTPPPPWRRGTGVNLRMLGTELVDWLLIFWVHVNQYKVQLSWVVIAFPPHHWVVSRGWPSTIAELAPTWRMVHLGTIKTIQKRKSSGMT